MPVILIAEDHLPTQLALCTLTRMSGHKSVGASNGQEALTYLQSNPVDLLLLDMMMPIMGGIELLKILRANPRLQSIPVVVYSACDEPAYRDEAMAAGANEYLIKSQIDWQSLGNRLAEYLPSR